MNDELIKREALIKWIDEWTDEILPDDLVELLQDCRAEIKRLTKELKESQALCLKFAQDRETQDAENESLRNKNTALGTKLAEYSERKYVPMTDKELKEWYANQPAHNPAISIWFYEKELEAEVIRRAGLEVKS